MCLGEFVSAVLADTVISTCIYTFISRKKNRTLVFHQVILVCLPKTKQQQQKKKRGENTYYGRVSFAKSWSNTWIYHVCLLFVCFFLIQKQFLNLRTGATLHSQPYMYSTNSLNLFITKPKHLTFKKKDYTSTIRFCLEPYSTNSLNLFTKCISIWP